MTLKEAKNQHKAFLNEFRRQLEQKMFKPYVFCLAFEEVRKMEFKGFVKEAARGSKWNQCGNFYSAVVAGIYEEMGLPPEPWTTIKINGFEINFIGNLYHLAKLHKQTYTKDVR